MEKIMGLWFKLLFHSPKEVILSASEEGKLELIQDLLKSKCGSEIKGEDIIEAFKKAALCHNYSIMDYFLSCDDIDVDLAYEYAIYARYEKLLLQLVKKGINKEKALVMASGYGFIRIVEELVQAGTNVNTHAGVNGATPLIKAIDALEVDIVDYLLKSGADISCIDADGNTVLHGLADAANVENLYEGRESWDKACIQIWELLKQAGAHINPINHKNETPLDWACWDYNCLREILKEHGAKHAKELEL